MSADQMPQIIPASESTNLNDLPSIKASDRSRTKNLTGHHRDFSDKSVSEMEASANKIYAQAKNKFDETVEADKTHGFDINDPESVKNFNIEYTPLGNTVLIKEISEEHKVGSIFLPAGSYNQTKALVIVPGLLVGSLLERGDVICIKPSPNGKIDSISRILNGVEFKEIDFHAVAGIFKSEAVMKARVEELNKRAKGNA